MGGGGGGRFLGREGWEQKAKDQRKPGVQEDHAKVVVLT